MKERIKLFATQVPYEEEELEDGVVYVSFNIEELLEQIGDKSITDYAMNYLSMICERDIQLETFDEASLIEALEYTNYNFCQKIDIEDAIDIVEQEGYTVSVEDAVDFGLDAVDDSMLQEIIQKYLGASWSERVEMYNKVKL